MLSEENPPDGTPVAGECGALLDAVVVAAGRSVRMGFDKVLATFRGRSVLEWSLDALARCPEVSRIVVVCAPDRESEISSLLGQTGKLHAIVPGGVERSESVAAGARALGGPDPGRWVAVHDAARPLVSPMAISACFEAARQHGAAALASRVVDTLHRTGAEGLVAETVSREHLWQVQTPQILRSDLLDRVLSGSGGTDEVGCLRRIGIPAVLVENPGPNPKLTVPADLVLVDALATSAGPRFFE